MNGYIKRIAPIFILKTRSFWFGIFPLLLTAIESMFAALSSGGDGGPIVAVLATVTGADPEALGRILLSVAPLWGLIIAQQRSGLARPYTLDLRAEKAVQAVEDGREAFEQGKALGKALKRKL